MKGNARLLHEFMEGHKIQLEIPVYQRNYDWRQENCEQLLNDLVKLAKSDAKNHFFGSIVSIKDDYSDNRIIIDGQQRLTSVSLLLLAAIKAVCVKNMTIISQSRLDEAFEIFLQAKYCNNHEKRNIKLVPIENDLLAYDKVFVYSTSLSTDEHVLELDSNMTRNFKYFYNRLSKNIEDLSFDELLNALERLLIIDINLDAYDDAQLIFESLNSTGLALTEADKVRNYLLMRLSPEEQQECFENYWLKIEELTANDPSKFLRPYLTIKQSLSRLEKKDKLYLQFKKDFKGKDQKAVLQDMLKYATYYQLVNEAKFDNAKLSRKMSHICNTNIDTVHVFFMSFLDYAYEHQLSVDEIWNVIDVIENFLARRLICGVNSNALTGIFCSLHKDVLKSINEYHEAGRQLNYSYFDILVYHLLRRKGAQIWPRDEQFINGIKTSNIYEGNKHIKRFFFERLENSMPGEYNDVIADIESGNATIEHIMPQTLKYDWHSILGPRYQEIYDKYLHTFANLTLTGINSKLSNHSFTVKRDGRSGTTGEGYKDSKYRLTRSVSACQQWTEKELEARANEMVETFLKLYPLPQTDFKPLLQASFEVYLSDDDFEPSNSKIIGCRVFDKEYRVSNWNELLERLIKYIDYKYPDEMRDVYKNILYFKTGVEVKDQSSWIAITTNRYISASISDIDKLNILRYIMEQCNISETDIVLILAPVNS